MSVGSLHPASLPFDAYLRDTPSVPNSAQAIAAHHLVAMAKRILLQQGVKDFTAADVLVLAAFIRDGRP